MCDAIEYAKLHLKEEYDELLYLLFISSSKLGRRQSLYVTNKIRQIILKINTEYQFSRFADFRRIEENDSLIKDFKENTKYGCGLWLHNANILNKENSIWTIKI